MESIQKLRIALRLLDYPPTERVNGAKVVETRPFEVGPSFELELKLIQYQMTQKPMLRCEGECAPVRAANKPRSQEKKGGVCVVSHCL